MFFAVDVAVVGVIVVVVCCRMLLYSTGIFISFFNVNLILVGVFLFLCSKRQLQPDLDDNLKYQLTNLGLPARKGDDDGLYKIVIFF